jgi:hypothetical protein
MENFEALQDIDNFCKVLVKKTNSEKPDNGGKSQTAPSEGKEFLDRRRLHWHWGSNSTLGSNLQPEHDEPFIDVFDEIDHIKILVQCRCQEQQVTFHPSKDGLVVCREECYREKDGQEMCTDLCRKLRLPTDGLQLDNMEFIVAKCNNNNTLEAMIPKL